MDKIKAEWCRQFSELLLASGKWKDVGAVVWLANEAYSNAQLLSPEQAVHVLGHVGESMVRPGRGPWKE